MYRLPFDLYFVYNDHEKYTRETCHSWETCGFSVSFPGAYYGPDLWKVSKAVDQGRSTDIIRLAQTPKGGGGSSSSSCSSSSSGSSSSSSSSNSSSNLQTNLQRTHYSFWP